MSEEMLAYELGYRKQVNDQLSFELATFFNDYQNLFGAIPVGSIPGIPPIVQTQLRNSQNAQSYGAELNFQWEAHKKWRLKGWYSWINIRVTGTGDNGDAVDTPRNQAYLMSSWDLPRKFEFDLMSRYVQSIEQGEVPGYTNLDARFGWRPNKNWDFSIIGQNLLAPHHLEFSGETTIQSAVNRGIYAQVVWQR